MDELKEENLDVNEVKEGDLDMNKVRLEEAVEAVVVAMEDVEKEVIIIATTKIEDRITIMELIHWILQGTLHLKKSQLLFKIRYGTIFVLN